MIYFILSFTAVSYSAKRSACLLYEIEYCADCPFQLCWTYECADGSQLRECETLQPSASGTFTMHSNRCDPDDDCADITLLEVNVDGNIGLPNNGEECPRAVCDEMVKIIWGATVVEVIAVIDCDAEQCVHP